MKTKGKSMNKPSSSSSSSPSPSFPSKNNPSSVTPLSDLTNNLIPFPSLLNLCDSTSSNDENRNPKSFEFTTPSRRVATPKTPPLCEGGSGGHNGRRGDVKSKEAMYGLTDPFVVEKNSRKASRMPSTRPVRLETILDKNLGGVVSSRHLNSRLPAKNKEKGKEIALSPTRSAPLKTDNDKGKAIDVTPIRPAPLETRKNKGIVFVTPADGTRSKDTKTSSLFDKLKVKDIEIGKPSVTFGSCHLIEDKDKHKGSSLSSRYPVILNEPKGKVMKTSATSKGLSSETKNKDALLTPLNLCSKKADHKGKSVAVPSDCQPPSKPNENLVKEMEIFTCPPLPRTRSTRKRTSKDDVSQPPKSWTDPHPKKPKTRRTIKEADQLDFLPKEFVEKHRAYFKEVDEFELQEEEISGDDLDKE